MISRDLSEFLSDLDQSRASATLIAGLGMSPEKIRATNSLSSALVVLLCGRFESFLKAALRSFVEDINSSFADFDSLPENFRYCHFKQGARALQDSISKARETGDMTPLFNLTDRLASVASFPYEVVWEAFTSTNSNPGPETVKQLMGNVGISDAWQKIKSVSAGHGDLKSFLDSFIQVRNECAHTGSNVNPVSPLDVISYADSLAALSNILARLLIEHCAICVA